MEDAVIDETNPRVRVISVRIQDKSEKKKVMNFLTRLDHNPFTSLLDELANDLEKGKNNYPNEACNSLRPIRGSHHWRHGKQFQRCGGVGVCYSVIQ